MEFAIIVAGGAGARMKSVIPKQFLELEGKPILMHTVEAFTNYSQTLRIIVVLPGDSIELWNKAIEKHHFQISHDLVIGGNSRTQSVANGLALIDSVKEEDVVAVHDGVRPFISAQLIRKSFAEAANNGTAVVTVPVKESLRQLVSESRSRAVQREEFMLVQTPQVFKVPILKSAYNQLGHLVDEDDFTDDASLVERFGTDINWVEGSYENIKITTPEDLVIAQAILKAIKKDA